MGIIRVDIKEVQYINTQKGETMSILSSVLKVFGGEKNNVAVAKELNSQDPDDKDAEKILAKHELKKQLDQYFDGEVK